MLALTRGIDSELEIGDAVVKVVDIRGNKVVLGVTAPREVRIMRREARNQQPPPHRMAPSTRIAPQPLVQTNGVEFGTVLGEMLDVLKRRLKPAG